MEVSIIQWNIWYKEKVENIAKFLVANKADIICLQELTVNSPYQNIKDTPKYIASQLNYKYHNQIIPLESTEGTSPKLANGIFSKFPIKSKNSLWINEPTSGGGYDDQYRAYVEVGLKVENKILEIGTTHMSYTDKFIDTDGKKQESFRLAEILKTKKTNFIFTGDLNSQPNSFTINTISNYLKFAGPDLNQKTWTTKPFSYKGFEETNLNWRLDYVFTSKDVQVMSSEILKTSYSDHLPILTKIKIT